MPDLKSRQRPAVDVQLQLPQLVEEAADLTRYILAADPERLRHSEAVAVRAQLMTAAVDDDQAAFLVAAAWLHDIGYAPGLKETGFHPLDGARHLRATGWPPALCDLVAHHSGSRFVATVRRLDDRAQRVRLPGGPAHRRADRCRPDSRTERPPDDRRRADPRHAGPPWSRLSDRTCPRPPWTVPVEAARRVASRLEAFGIAPSEHHIF